VPTGTIRGRPAHLTGGMGPITADLRSNGNDAITNTVTSDGTRAVHRLSRDVSTVRSIRHVDGDEGRQQSRPVPGGRHWRRNLTLTGSGQFHRHAFGRGRLRNRPARGQSAGPTHVLSLAGHPVSGNRQIQLRNRPDNQTTEFAGSGFGFHESRTTFTASGADTKVRPARASRGKHGGKRARVGSSPRPRPPTTTPRNSAIVVAGLLNPISDGSTSSVQLTPHVTSPFVPSGSRRRHLLIWPARTAPVQRLVHQHGRFNDQSALSVTTASEPYGQRPHRESPELPQRHQTPTVANGTWYLHINGSGPRRQRHDSWAGRSSSTAHDRRRPESRGTRSIRNQNASWENPGDVSPSPTRPTAPPPVALHERHVAVIVPGTHVTSTTSAAETTVTGEQSGSSHTRQLHARSPSDARWKRVTVATPAPSPALWVPSRPTTRPPTSPSARPPGGGTRATWSP